MVPLSAVVITQNEEDKLAEALQSVAFCDEIVVVDSGSLDRTREVAVAAGARVILNEPWPGFAAQRNVAVDAARNDWVIALDADERVAAPLREEIQSRRARGFDCAGYRIPRVAFYLGRWVRATDWYPDPQVRLFDRTRARWEGVHVHESVRVRGKVGRLRSDMEHHPYSDIGDHMKKIDRYTTLWAQQAFEAGRRTSIPAMAGNGLWTFLRNYVLKRGFILGSAGFTISVLNSYYTYTKLAKLQELSRTRGGSLKVLHVDTARSWRGGQNQVLLTSLGMAERGHEVTLACRAQGELRARAEAAGIATRPARFQGDLGPFGILALTRALRETRPDVMHLHDPHAVSAGLVARRLARSRTRVIATRRVDFRLRSLPSRVKYRACDRVIAVSRAIADLLRADGLPDARIRLVYEGVPDRPPSSGGQEALAALGVPLGCPVVGNVAALTGHKDHATLIEATALLRERLPGVVVVIAGEGELRPALEAQARALGLSGSVIFAGFRTDLDRLLPAFTVFCLSSHMEGLGTSLLDAMAFGRPVVATAAGGIPEAVEDGRTGLLVRPRDPRALADALQALLTDEPRARALGAAGRERFLSRFSAAHMVEATLQTYSEGP